MSLIKCYICGQTVSDKATTCPHCGNVIVKSQYKDRIRYRDYIKSPIPESMRPKSYLIHSVLLGLSSLILFTIWCLPFAIVSFIYANKVDRLWENGDIDGAYYASRSAHKWYSIGWWIGILSWLLIILLLLLLIVGLTD